MGNLGGSEAAENSAESRLWGPVAYYLTHWGNGHCACA